MHAQYSHFTAAYPCKDRFSSFTPTKTCHNRVTAEADARNQMSSVKVDSYLQKYTVMPLSSLVVCVYVWATPMVIRSSSWLCAQGSFLVSWLGVHMGYGVLNLRQQVGCVQSKKILPLCYCSCPTSSLIFGLYSYK